MPDHGPLPSGRHGLDPEEIAANQRARLIAAIASVVAAKGYAATSVNDIVAAAGTSKRTFYEHFTDKEDCYLQAYDQFSINLFNSIAGRLDPEGEPSERATDAIRALVDGVSSMPEASQAFLVEIGAAGTAAMNRRMAFIRGFADRYVEWRHQSRERNPQIPELSNFRALTSVLSLTEVISMQVRTSGAESVTELTDDLVDLAVWFTRADEQSSK
jgi:AcrR family transcriptional regulator